MDAIRSSSDEKNDALRQNLRRVIGGMETLRPYQESNYFDQLKESVREIQATHYSPKKVVNGLGEIPPLANYKEKDSGEKSSLKKEYEESNKRKSGYGKLSILQGSRFNEPPKKANVPEFAIVPEFKKNPEFGTKVPNKISKAQLTKPTQVPERKSKADDGTSRGILLAHKIDAQNDRIAQLEAEVQRIKNINHKLEEANRTAHQNLELQREEMQEQLARAHLANLEQMLKATGGYERNENYGHDDIGVDADEDDKFEEYTRHGLTSHNTPLTSHQGNKNTSLGPSIISGDRHQNNDSRHRISLGLHENIHVTSPDYSPPPSSRADVYKVLYQQTARKLRASIQISEFQARTIQKLSSIHVSTESTTQLINGTVDSTTAFLGTTFGSDDSTSALILGSHDVYDDVYPKRRTPLATLRAVIWAVRFTIRILRQGHLQGGLPVT